ncbi:MAG TPA: hypothetical protein VKR41_03095, partial [Puia sp.]|nr:hypothetical protein [Puia sp.]
CLRCFGHPMVGSLTETESKLMHARIFDETGLVVGWKSIKNYSVFVSSPDTAKQENPSVATLDTFSRYVMGAPYTTEPERKKEAGHYPYWFAYKAKKFPGEPEGKKGRRWRWFLKGFWWRFVLGCVLVVVVVVVALIVLVLWVPERGFVERFGDVSVDSLKTRGWWVEAPDTNYWGRRGEKAGCLTLYTLRGDNWPDSVNRPKIRNLLLHRVDCDCWTIEVHLQDFVPVRNWQQAGILLMEDTGFNGTSMRVSIAFNDFNGVYPRSGTILVQGIASRSRQDDKPEEFAHVILLQTDSVRSHPNLYQVLAHSALRIEKQGNLFRILYADGITETTSFKEIASYPFNFRPHYVGLFALRGYVDSSAAVPARFTYFGLDCCKRR